MYKLLCFSNRHLCKDDFAERIRNIADCGIPVVLREKDLSEEDYFNLLCKINRKNIIAHSFVNAAKKFGLSAIHLPLPLLEHSVISDFETVGCSTHSLSQAARAEFLGADYITAGHVFATDCKKGLTPHGTELISTITAKIKIPVFGLGGISQNNSPDVISAGAYGVAVMSGFMTCTDLYEYIASFRNILS